MQVLLNPSITNNKYQNQLSHKAVIPKYVEIAKKDIKKYGFMDSIVLRKLLEDTILFKKVSIADSIDTFEYIRNFTPNAANVIDDYLKVLKT